MAHELPVGRVAPDARFVEPLRLLWLIDSLTMGGAETLVLNFARACRERNIDLTVCSRTTIGGNPLEDELREIGVRVENLQARNLRDAGAFVALLHLIRERNIQIMHAHLTYAAIWGAAAARLTNVAFLATLHVPPQTRDRRNTIRQALMERLLRRYASRVLVVSDALRQAYLGSRIPPDKIHVLHNGIDVFVLDDHHRERAATLQELGIEESDFVVTTVAVLREGKGINVLLRAIRDVVSRRTRMRFLIVGDGPLHHDLTELAEQLDVSHAVTWAGYRRDVARLLRASDLFVLPTLTDAFPTVVLEAMEAGLPVIASDIGGVPEIVTEKTGKLVAAGDSQALAAAILEAESDQGWRHRVGKQARRTLEHEFSTSAWIGRLEQLYSEILRERGMR